MSMVGFPLLLIPLAIYNIFVFLMPGVAFTSPIVSVTLMSHAQWTLTFGDALLALAMILLWFEIVKASRPGARFLTDHLLSLIVFGVAAAEFLLLGKFGNSTFFLLMILTAVEFLAGASIAIRHRKFVAHAATAELVRHEPAMNPENDDDHSQQEETKSSTLKTSRPLPSECPPSKALPSKPQPSVAMRSEPKPPDMVTMMPAHETLQQTSQETLQETSQENRQETRQEAAKPVPTLAVVHEPDAMPAPARKVTGWTVADLVRDEPSSDEPSKP